MKYSQLIALSILLTALTVSADPSFSPLPVDLWQVQSKEGDVLRLGADGDCLRLDLDFDVRDEVLHGHVTVKQATARILLRKPLKLAPEQRRIIFEAAGIRKTIEKNSYLQLLPLVRDAEGEILLYEPYPMPHLLAGGERWTQWSTRYLYGAEAGGATQSIFLAEGNGNAWPDGDLEFLGFEVQLRPDKFARCQHTLTLGTIEFGDMVIPYRDPFVYADALAKTAGDYRFAAEVAGQFQGPALRQVAQEFRFDPALVSTGRQRLTIPLGPDGNYWIRYQVNDSAGKVVGGNTLRYIVEQNANTTALRPVSTTEPPLLGCMRINAERHVGGVYAAAEPLAVDLRLFAKGATALTVEWRLMPYGFATELAKGAETVSFDGRPFRDLVITPPADPERDAYRLALTVKRDGQVIDSAEYVLGRRTDFSQPRNTRQGLLRGRDYVKRSAYFRTTYNPETTKSEADYLANFSRYLDETVKISGYVTYSIDLAEFEILPGVFDLYLLDRVMDAASDRGCTITIRSLHIDAKSTYRWLPYSRQVSYDGSEIVQHFYGSYSGIDPIYLDLWKRANRAMYDRYRLHPGFQGYYLMMPGGEWSIMCDKPWIGVVAGYEKASRQAFVDYLKTVKKWSLTEVNTRWNAKYSDWGEVLPPKPEFRTGTIPDMRVQWLDFCRFKDYINTAYWYLALAQDIRSYDSERVVIVYAPPTIAGIEKLIDYTHGGGVPSLPGAGEGEENWLKNHVGTIQESHHPHRWNCYGDPGGHGWVLDWCLYTMISAYGGGGANLHIYYVPLAPIVDNYGQEHGYDRYEKFKPIFRELQEMLLMTSNVRQIAIYQDPTSVFCKHRSSFSFRLPDLARWHELPVLAGLDHERLEPSRIGQYKLLLPNLIDEVVSRDSIDLLDGYVRGGGKMILSAVNGRYCPELGTATYPLLDRLGINPPEKPFVTKGLDVTATAGTASPFWAAGAKIPFFTTQNLHDDPQRDAEVRKNFFHWPYRWIPQTDYFGYYPGHKVTDGQVLATFADGGAAVSMHNVGKGQVLIFWGTPDYKPALMLDFVRAAASWAKVENSKVGNPIPLMFEGKHRSLKRHYVILWQEKPGTYAQGFPQVPDGNWFVEDLVSDDKLGTWTAAELRAGKLPLTFLAGQSPLKVLRIGEPHAGWMKKYRQPGEISK